MAKLIYAALMSLDGYIADEAGNFDWAVPDEEVHAFINDLEQPIGAYLYGRKMYETMAAWETPETIPDRTPAMLDFATVWQAANKVVYSRTLEAVHTAKTRLEREFDPKAILLLKAQSSRDIAIGGPTLAAHAIRHLCPFAVSQPVALVAEQLHQPLLYRFHLHVALLPGHTQILHLLL
jgi:dihydrofolate reductase